MITQYFTLNINILHVVYVFKMETRMTWLIRNVYDKKNRRIIAYVAKKLMDNDILLVIAKNTILFWLSQ